jgi:hypothetical protein
MNIAEHLKHNYTLTRSCKEIGAFGETGEPFGRLDFRMGQRARSTCLPFASRTM